MRQAPRASQLVGGRATMRIALTWLGIAAVHRCLFWLNVSRRLDRLSDLALSLAEAERHQASDLARRACPDRPYG